MDKEIMLCHHHSSWFIILMWRHDWKIHGFEPREIENEIKIWNLEWKTIFLRMGTLVSILFWHSQQILKVREQSKKE